MFDSVNRRNVLMSAGTAGVLSALPAPALAQGAPGIGAETAPAGFDPAPFAKQSIKFAVIGLDHYHIMGMTAAVQRGGGKLVKFYTTDPKQIADFRAKFGDIKLAKSEDEILNDKSIKLVCGAPIPDQRAPLGIRVMKADKDYLSDKPAITTLEQLAEVRKTVAETKKKFAIMYSERLEVKAAIQVGYLIDQGAIGKVIQTVNLAPHRIGNVDAGGRPEWFWHKHRYGGILTDIGSHQIEQFLYYTKSTSAHVVASQAGNVAHPQYPEFEDFGDMVAVGNGGTGYIRVDWFTPDGLPTWGDGRLFLLGTEGYIELRKYYDVSGRPGGNHLFIADKKGVRYIDCNNVVLPFGPLFVRDIIDRTEKAQNQDEALLTAELVLTAQKNATKPVIT
ncbi:Gfo/Idh/MocA family protein [Rhizomicrobium electricum]|uniref:Gfo/Idh/MocA family oxidoreductase n=1 Tax=Rhizomicrobium electricum TaxID=480070 RepID=A0ABN1ERP6_9PROT|nr:Gfo/Idh/MocA family oxidoreductase [Rhizomicrobium electricum]NIJ48900.1 putative dehydrogenase [Rhizomicrobium electricum]